MFEVGKKYHKHLCKTIYECLLATETQVVLKVVSTGHIFIEFQANFSYNHYEEYVPPKPLTFADLKVGEKFKWVKPKACGSAICTKLCTVGNVHISFIYKSCYGWTHGDGVIYQAHETELVERVV